MSKHPNCANVCWYFKRGRGQCEEVCRLMPEKMMSKHTPGPWVVVTPEREPIRVSTGAEPTAIHVCTVTGHGADSHADASLIAAAPDLLDACERAERLFDSGPLQFSREHVSELSAIRAAIKKAKGEA